MESFDVAIGSIAWLAAIVALVQLAMIVLVIVVLLDIRRFIGEAIPLMRRISRWLAGREE